MKESLPNKASSEPELSRYSRQILFEKIGVAGQRRLRDSRAVLFGCGALGSVLANTLVRAGLGYLRICDRDVVERNNLQRQVLFDEADVERNAAKANAAAEKLAGINSDVTVEPHVIDVNPGNIEELAEGTELLLDGTDNFETRYLINDLAVKTRRPWVYGAVIGSTGLCMTIVPKETPCLRCVFENAPPQELSPTCDTVGVLGSAVNAVASLQAVEAIKLLIGRNDEINRHLVKLDVWTGRFANVNIRSARESGTCPCCNCGEFPHLAGKFMTATTTLCGRNAVQLNRRGGLRVDFAAIATKLEPVASTPVRHNPFLLQADVDGFELTLFADGRAIIKGTREPRKARSLYAKYFGA